MREIATVHIAAPPDGSRQRCVVCGQVLIDTGPSPGYEIGAPVAVTRHCVYRVGAVRSDPEPIEVGCVMR